MKFEKLPIFKILKNQNTLKCMKFGCGNLKSLQFYEILNSIKNVQKIRFQEKFKMSKSVKIQQILMNL